MRLLIRTSSIFLLASQVYAGPLGYKDGRSILKFKETFFYSNANYNNSGVESRLPSNGSFQSATSSLSYTHDLSDSFSMYGVFDAVWGKTVGSEFERTRFIPTDLRAGFDFSAAKGFADIVPEFQVTVPLATVSERTDEAVLSEGVTEVRGGSYLAKNLGWFSGYGYLGYAHRTDGRSALLPYELQSLFGISGFSASLGVWGYQSISDDKFTNDPGRRGAVTSRVNGGSLRFYAINPNVTEAGFSLGLPVADAMFIRFGMSTTVRGERTASGQTFWLSLSHVAGEAKLRHQYREQKKVEEKTQETRKKEFVPETYPEDVESVNPENPLDNNVKDIETKPAVPQKPLGKPGTALLEEQKKKKSSGPAPEVVLRSSKSKKSKKKR